MAELLTTFDVVEQILVRLDVEDLLRCKSVCKSWLSLISSPPFVKAHLNHCQMKDRNNPQLGHRRIVSPLVYTNFLHLIGSCNGLVCVSPQGAQLVVANTSTGEHNQLPTPPHNPPPVHDVRRTLCWGFGYDSSADDYKVVAGLYSKNITLFYALTLKSNIWRVIGQVKYRCHLGIDGVLCGGALHWLMGDDNKKLAVLIALDLSTDEFKEIPLPPEYEWNYEHQLGVLESCLCIYSSAFPLKIPLCTKKWVMKNNNKWQVYNDDHCENKYDVVHHLTAIWNNSRKVFDYQYGDGDVERVPSNGDYLRMGLFVKSLVSPNPHQLKQGEEAGNNTRKRKRKRKRKRTRKHKRQI